MQPDAVHAGDAVCRSLAPVPDLCLAPMRGLTDALFRRVFARHFSGVDRCLAPFLPLPSSSRIRDTYLADVSTFLSEALPVIPQVIGNDPEVLATLAAAVARIGFRRLNLNAGCPRKDIVRRQRGAGLLADPDRLQAMLEAGCSVFPTGFSIKVRLGIDAPGTLAERWDVLNRFPLDEVMVHPRTAVQGYGGVPDLDAFQTTLARARLPVVYNGDIGCLRVAWDRMRRFPSVTRWMLGRGLVGNPFLAESIRAGRAIYAAPRLLAFLEDLLESTAGRMSPAPVLGRSKAVWRYLASGFAEGADAWREVRRMETVSAYRHWLRNWFAAGPEWRMEDGPVSWMEADASVGVKA